MWYKKVKGAPFPLCKSYRDMEYINNELTTIGKEHLWHLVNDIGVHPIEAMNDLLLTHQNLFHNFQRVLDKLKRRYGVN